MEKEEIFLRSLNAINYFENKDPGIWSVGGRSEDTYSFNQRSSPNKSISTLSRRSKILFVCLMERSILCCLRSINHFNNFTKLQKGGTPANPECLWMSNYSELKILQLDKFKVQWSKINKLLTINKVKNLKKKSRKFSLIFKFKYVFRKLEAKRCTLFHNMILLNNFNSILCSIDL